MEAHFSLPALLSQALVAFTIECDNEAERRIPHTTTDHGSASRLTAAPWLTSIVMWMKCMRHLEGEPISLAELERRARTPTNLDGMKRWGYIVVAPDPADARPKPPQNSWLVRPTAAGRVAQQIWSTLPNAIGKHWRQRFGDDLVDRLREALYPIVRTLDPQLPDCLPILGYGLVCKLPDPKAIPRRADEDPASLSLLTLLSRTLLAFALEFERESYLSLAICANPVRVLSEAGVRMRDLPILTGVSKESISMAMGILRKAHLVIEERDPAGSSSKLVRLNSAGREIQRNYLNLLSQIEHRWQSRYGADSIARLCEPLEELAGDGSAEHSPLFACIQPNPGGWRAAVRPPKTLPHFPMVLHRGGYPDGS